MSILTKGGNGRLIKGWNKTQTDQEISKGRLSPSDLVLHQETNEIYVFGQTWGGKSPDKAKLEGFPIVDESIFPKTYGLTPNVDFNGSTGKDIGIPTLPSRIAIIPPPVINGTEMYLIGINGETFDSYKYIIPNKGSGSGEGALVAISSPSVGFTQPYSRFMSCRDIGLVVFNNNDKGTFFYDYKKDTWVTLTVTGDLSGIYRVQSTTFNIFDISWDNTSQTIIGTLLTTRGDPSPTDSTLVGIVFEKYLVKVNLANNTLTLTRIFVGSPWTLAVTYRGSNNQLVCDYVNGLAYVCQPISSKDSTGAWIYHIAVAVFELSTLTLISLNESGAFAVDYDKAAKDVYNTIGFTYGSLPIFLGKWVYDPLIGLINEFKFEDISASELRGGVVAMGPIWEDTGLFVIRYVSGKIILHIYDIARKNLNIPITSEDSIVSAIQKLGYAVEDTNASTTTAIKKVWDELNAVEDTNASTTTAIKKVWDELNGVNNAMTELENVSQ